MTAIVPKSSDAELSAVGFSLVDRPHGLPREQIRSCIDSLLNYLQLRASRCIGYQVNHKFDYSPLVDFFNLNINNVGDPYIDSNYGVNTRKVERSVLEFFADIFRAQGRDYWGYITSGGTEANMQGLYLGRLWLEQKFGGTPVAYFSEDTHYSIRKALRMLQIDYRVIPSTPEGAIRVPDLMEALLNSHLDSHPPLIIATLGTSFKGAYDDVEGIVAQLRQHQIEQFYLHVDAALGGLFLPFLTARAGERSALSDRVPVFDFRLPIGSIAVSGHKTLGTPVPCAVLMTLRRYLVEEGETIDYIGTRDSTLSGSRSGLAPILLWYAIATQGFQGLRQRALQMLAMADYATQRLRQAGVNAWKNDLGLAVVFDRPPAWIVRKWSLATSGHSAHIFTMHHVTQKLVDSLAEDLERARQGRTERSATRSHFPHRVRTATQRSLTSASSWRKHHERHTQTILQPHRPRSL